MKKIDKNTPFYFPDCHICTVVKQADDSGDDVSYEELIQAFRKQKSKLSTKQ